MTAHPCTICTKNVKEHNKKLRCEICNGWVHIKCNLIDDKTYRNYLNNNRAYLNCLKCIENSIPFSTLNDSQFCIAVKEGYNFLVEPNLQFHQSNETNGN